ncbi:hypothetical protein EH220_05125 [bacterium]|nr:MAG: hypothetical protein EH220_05125 [bacterium]
MVTAKEVAQWMHNEIMRTHELYQSDAASDIESKFGQDFVYTNDDGGTCISKSVLKEFLNLNRDTVVWIRGKNYWRLREKGDEPSRQQSSWML